MGVLCMAEFLHSTICINTDIVDVFRVAKLIAQYLMENVKRIHSRVMRLFIQIKISCASEVFPIFFPRQTFSVVSRPLALITSTYIKKKKNGDRKCGLKSQIAFFSLLSKVQHKILSKKKKI